jgi:hypothetical protein
MFFDLLRCESRINKGKSSGSEEEQEVKLDIFCIARVLF